jgi:uncharacterized membrane protein YidH (DUF202 family)
MYKPTASFYFLPTRGFELIIGAFVAFHRFDDSNVKVKRTNSNYFNQLMSLVGVLLIIYAVFAFGKTTPFPSFYTLVPTLGTALIINFATSNTIVGRILGIRLLVGIGLISYSAYLWYQPLFAFARLRSFDKPSAAVLLCLSIVAIVLAYLSWKFIERPFRDKQFIGRKRIFISSAVVSLFMIATGIVGYRSDSFDKRKFADGTLYQDIDYRIRSNYGLDEACNGKTTFSEKCRNHEQPEILVWGDSFAMHLVQGILASNPEAKIIQMTWSSCAPFYNLAPYNGSEYNEVWAKECMAFNNRVLGLIDKNPSIKYVAWSRCRALYS